MEALGWLKDDIPLIFVTHSGGFNFAVPIIDNLEKTYGYKVNQLVAINAPILNNFVEFRLEGEGENIQELSAERRQQYVEEGKGGRKDGSTIECLPLTTNTCLLSSKYPNNLNET